jgi:hypothetical protein
MTATVIQGGLKNVGYTFPKSQIIFDISDNIGSKVFSGDGRD